MSSPRGVLMFAHNNEEIDYFRIASANALLVKKNLKVPVAILTDESTISWAKQSLGDDFINSCFDYVIISDRNYVYQQQNPRLYKDTVHSSKNLPFYNCNHWMAYDESPFEETLFIDSDYYIMSDALSKCWGSIHDVMINHDITDLSTMKPPSQTHIDVFGIKQYWATVIYFKKSEVAQHLFTLVKHVFDNYEYYRNLYLIRGTMFRNDYAFSIAVHMLNGFTEENSVIAQLPISTMLMSFDTDDICQVSELNNIVLLTAKPGESGTFTLLRCKDVDVHIINKWAANRMATRLIELYKE